MAKSWTERGSWLREFSKHTEGFKVLNYPSQIQVLVEKLLVKIKWSDKVIKFQRIRGKDAFRSFEEFAEEVRYYAERTNIPQLLQSPGITGSTPDRNKRWGHQSGCTRSLNVAWTPVSPPVDNK